MEKQKKKREENIDTKMQQMLDMKEMSLQQLEEISCEEERPEPIVLSDDEREV